MFELGHIPVVVAGWDYGFQAIWLKTPTWKFEHKRWKYYADEQLIREQALDGYKRSDLRSNSMALFNRQFLGDMHEPRVVAKNWNWLIGN
jgi:hypothetical protein